METIRHTLESVEDELKNLPQEIQGEDAATAEGTPEEKQQILAQLRKLFDAFDLNGIGAGIFQVCADPADSGGTGTVDRIVCGI